MLDAFDKPFARMYVAGKLDSMWGPVYQSACNNAEAMVFERIAGLNASKEKPWC